MSRTFYLLTVTALIIPEPTTFLAAGLLVVLLGSALVSEGCRAAVGRQTASVGWEPAH